jgi:hypothetical protein
MKRPTPIAAALSLALATTLAAQEDVTRRSYPFFADDLRIEVQTRLGGSIQLVRGGRATLEVVARVPGGIAAIGLSDRTEEVLRLTATGTSAADFIVSVPENVSVRIALPDSEDLLSIGLGPADALRWYARSGAPAPAPEQAPPPEEAAAAPQAPARGPASGERSVDRIAPGGGPTPTYVSRLAPDVVSIPDPANVRSLSVRLEGSDFRVGSSQPLRTIPGNAERLEIRTGGPPLDIVLQLPADVEGFMLKVGTDVAFTVSGGQPRAFCTPLVAQQAHTGGRWYDFTPRDGRLQCAP